MRSVPAVPQGVLDAERGCQTGQRWHQYAFQILPGPFGGRRLLDVGCGGGGVAVWADVGLRVTAAASYGHLPAFDALTFHKARTGKRRVFPIARPWESLFAGRFVWRLTKPP